MGIGPSGTKPVPRVDVHFSTGRGAPEATRCIFEQQQRARVCKRVHTQDEKQALRTTYQPTFRFYRFKLVHEATIDIMRQTLEPNLDK